MFVDPSFSPCVETAGQRTRNLAGWFGQHGEGALSSNVGAADMAFQNWFKFKEAYSPKLVLDVLQAVRRPVSRCVDPTGGSGTTGLVCSFADIDCETIEVNPFMVDLIRSKTQIYDIEMLSRDMTTVLLTPCGRGEDVDLPGAPSTMIEPGEGGRWVFSRPVAAYILAVVRSIHADARPEHGPILKVLLGSILQQASNVIVSGKGRKYRRGWENRTIAPSDVREMFGKACRSAIADVVRFAGRRRGTVTVRSGDARVLIPTVEEADCAIFSPPYPNSFDYTDIYNLELWMLGYLGSPLDNRSLRLATMHSHVQLKRETRLPRHRSTTLEDLTSVLESRRSELWSANIPSMLTSYFADLEGMVLDLHSRLRSGGTIALVVGSSAYAGVDVDVPQIMNELMDDAGIALQSRITLRRMRTSAQQGGMPGLSEEVVSFVV